MLYRILTEDVHREAVYDILDSHVDGYTVTPGIGSWRGVRENSLAIDIIGVPAITVQNIAREIKRANKQESVLILEIAADHKFIQD